MMRRGEFELIADLFAPLSDSDHGLSLEDDAALFAPRPGHTSVLTTDTLVAGVHFLADDPPVALAQKCLRVNLSDLAAMGATPRGYLVNLAVTDTSDDVWLEGFAAGLRADGEAFGVTLFGGDTVRTPGPATISVTAVGEVRTGRTLRRSGARVGDLIYVSGTVGDGIAGLRVQQAATDLEDRHRAFLVERYRLPQPRIKLGTALLGLATAALDVSDGLVADLRHICETSCVGARVDADKVPMSAATHAAIEARVLTREDAMSGGDDYELLFTAPAESQAALDRAAEAVGVPVTQIGAIIDGVGVQVTDARGSELRFERAGHTHF